MAEPQSAEYDHLRASTVRKCSVIDPADYQAGLLFNPDGYRSYYVRSECFQLAAIQFRDLALCDEVRERRSRLFSSWGYSRERCRMLVAEGVAADRLAIAELKRLYVQDPIRLRGFQIERNGNGHDVDIVPAFSGSFAHSYRLSFAIIESGSRTPAPLHASVYHLDARSNLRIYVRQAEIRGRFPGFALNRPYRVRASIVLDVGHGGPGGYWSDTFIERAFPVAERTQSIVSDVSFQP